MLRGKTSTMWGRAVAAATIAGSAVLWPGLVLAGGSNDGAAAAARNWLERIQGAAQQQNYQGTLVVTAGGVLSSSRLAHFCEGNQSYERIEMLNGVPRRVYRHNEQVMTIWPQAKVARIEQREPVKGFPAVLSGSQEQLFDRYELIAEGAERIAGLDAAVFLLRPRDAHRFAQRLWADQASGLLLRADVLAVDGHVLETAAFSELTIGVRSQPETVLAPMKRLQGYRVLRSSPRRTALDAEGWRLKVPVAGFEQVSCVKRSLDEAAGVDTPASADVVQSIFSDGLTHVSIFIEPFRADRHRPGTGVYGATHTLAQAVGSSWVTVMGDVPLSTLKSFAAALERLR